MSEQNEYRYIPVEVCLIPMFKKQAKDGVMMRDILDYGIVKLAKEMFKNMDGTEVLNQAIRAYYDGKLPGNLSNTFDECLSDDHRNLRGYSNGVFCGEHERELLSDYLSDSDSFDDDPIETFIGECLPYSQIHKAMHFLGLKGGSYDNYLKKYKAIKWEVAKHETAHGKDAMVMIKTDHFIDFSYNDKEAREWDIFIGYLAIKSIQGNSDFVATNKALIQARMIGAKNKDVAEVLTKDTSLKKLYKRYKERYFFDKLLLRVRQEYHVAEIGAFRKMFLSTKLTENELEKAVLNYAINLQINNADKQMKKKR